VRHREWRSIYGNALSLVVPRLVNSEASFLIAVKPHLEFSSFGDALSLVVPIATMFIPKRMIYLDTSKVT